MPIIPPRQPGPVKVVPPTVPSVLPGTDVVTAALAYAEAGLYVGPVTRGSKHPGSVLGPGWPSRTSRDSATIRGWFTDTDHGVMIHVGRSGLLVFDVDHPEGVPAALEEALDTYVPPFQSTRPGDPRRGHYVFALPPGVMLGNSPGSLGTGWGDVRGENGVIVVAPSEHAQPDGAYKWVRTGDVPQLPVELLEALQTNRLLMKQNRKGDRTGTLEVCKSYETSGVPVPSTHRRLSVGHLQMLHLGVSPSLEYRHADGELDRSKARMSLARAYVNGGATYQEFYADLTNPGHRASLWYGVDPEREPRSVERLLKRDWAAAEEYALTHPPITNAEDARQHLQPTREAATRATWSGRTGSRDRLILLTCLDEAHRRGGFSLTISVRELATLAGVSRSQAQRALQNLIAAGWMTRRQNGSRDGHASSYGFAVPPGVAATVPVPGIPALRNDDYWASLGPISMRIFEILAATHRTTTELVQMTGHSTSTVRRHVRGLVDDGMVLEVTRDTWSAVDLDAALNRSEELAQAHGVAGRLKRREEAYLRERMARAQRTDPRIRSRLLEVIDGHGPGSPCQDRRQTDDEIDLLQVRPKTVADDQRLGDVG